MRAPEITRALARERLQELGLRANTELESLAMLALGEARRVQEEWPALPVLMLSIRVSNDPGILAPRPELIQQAVEAGLSGVVLQGEWYSHRSSLQEVSCALLRHFVELLVSFELERLRDCFRPAEAERLRKALRQQQAGKRQKIPPRRY